MEIVLIVATLFGGVAALWFFWDKVAAFFKNDSPKNPHASNSSQEAILRLIGDSSPSAWRGRGCGEEQGTLLTELTY
ncbi:MAG: hypothetical protein ACREBU_09685 [Nitrososphaera sp.]